MKRIFRNHRNKRFVLIIFITMYYLFHRECEKKGVEGVHLTLPPHIISIQVKSRSMLHHGSVGASLKQNKTNI